MSAPNERSIRLVLPFWSANPAWMPIKPKLIVRIWPIVSLGLVWTPCRAAEGAVAVGINNRLSDHETIWQHGSLLDHHHAFLDRIQRVVGVLEVMASIDTHVVPDPAILVDDRVADIAAVADADGRKAVRLSLLDFLNGLVEVDAHEVTAHDGRPRADAGTDTDHAILDPGRIDDATFGDDRFFQCRAADLGRREHAGAGVDRPLVVEEVEVGDVLSEAEISFKK